MAKKHGDVKKKVNKKVVRKRKAGERSATRGAPSAYVWWTPVSEIVVGDFVILEHSGRNAEVVGVTVRDTVPTGIVLDMEAEHGASGKVVEDKSKLYENPTQRIDVVRATEPPAGYIRSGVK